MAMRYDSHVYELKKKKYPVCLYESEQPGDNITNKQRNKNPKTNKNQTFWAVVRMLRHFSSSVWIQFCPTLWAWRTSRPRLTHLITGTAAGFQLLCMVPATVDLAILVEVYEVHQQLLACAADKAMRVPAFSMACSGSENYDVPSIYLTTTL